MDSFEIFKISFFFKQTLNIFLDLIFKNQHFAYNFVKSSQVLNYFRIISELLNIIRNYQIFHIIFIKSYKIEKSWIKIFKLLCRIYYKFFEIFWNSVWKLIFKIRGHQEYSQEIFFVFLKPFKIRNCYEKMPQNLSAFL